ncbi:hypothetical protein Syun_029321 [Stephania yunnanensis]|uniref:Helicase C-terminal domain-containing protein n=1 Tax=Stephania yunnanensis TaxID=152371 RepID=A0AAP0E9Q4_9MAGN
MYVLIVLGKMRLLFRIHAESNRIWSLGLRQFSSSSKDSGKLDFTDLTLLAWEVAKRLNKANVPCDLITGQEREEIEGAKHKSVTVEMADVASDYQCAVIDEIQASAHLFSLVPLFLVVEYLMLEIVYKEQCENRIRDASGVENPRSRGDLPDEALLPRNISPAGWEWGQSLLSMGNRDCSLLARISCPDPMGIPGFPEGNPHPIRNYRFSLKINMVGCNTRGSSFTRALLGLPADELHLCGDAAAVPLVQKMLAATGDSVKVQYYERLSPLVPSKVPLGAFSNIKTGDCVVTFSRREIYKLKKEIEGGGKHLCSVVYGSLPSGTRTRQATMFNDEHNFCDILVASDAIGMGLNLNISRIIFSTLRKFDGLELRNLTVPEIKQIAGRAGRYGSRFPNGEVTCLNKEDLPLIHSALESSSPFLEKVAAVVDELPLGLQEKYLFCNSIEFSTYWFLLDPLSLRCTIGNERGLWDHLCGKVLQLSHEPGPEQASMECAGYQGRCHASATVGVS